MINQVLKEFALENNWYCARTCVLGLYKGYYFQLNDEERCKILSCDFDEVTEETRENIEANLLEKNKNVSAETTIVTNNYIAISFAEVLLKTNIETLKKGLNSVVEVLASNSVPQGIGCSHCGSKDNLRYYYNTTNNLVRRLCPDCAAKEETKKNQEEQDKLFEEKKYTREIIGSVLFSIIGIAVWVLMSVYLKNITQIGVIVLGALILIGDSKFKRTKQSTPLWILAIIFLLSVIITNYIIAGNEIYTNYPNVTLRVLLNNFLYNSSLFSWIMKRVSVSVFICAIPIVILFFQKSTKINGPEWVMAEKITNNYEERIS